MKNEVIEWGAEWLSEVCSAVRRVINGGANPECASFCNWSEASERATIPEYCEVVRIQRSWRGEWGQFTAGSDRCTSRAGGVLWGLEINDRASRKWGYWATTTIRGTLELAKKRAKIGIKGQRVGGKIIPEGVFREREGLLREGEG